MPGSAAGLARDRAVVATTGEALSSKMTAVPAATTTGVHKDPMTIADDATEMTGTTDDGVDPEMPITAAANPECRAVPNGGAIAIATATATAKPLAQDLETHAEPANVPQLEADAITHAPEAPKQSTGTYLGVAKSAMTAATASVILVDTVVATTAVTAHAATDLGSTTAGTRETAPLVRVETLEAPEILQSEEVVSKIQIATYLVVLARTTKMLTVKGSEIARKGRGAEVGAGVEIGIEIENETVIEIRDGVAVDRGVEIVEAEDAVSGGLQIWQFWRDYTAQAKAGVIGPPDTSDSEHEGSDRGSWLVLLMRYTLVIRATTNAHILPMKEGQDPRYSESKIGSSQSAS